MSNIKVITGPDDEEKQAIFASCIRESLRKNPTNFFEGGKVIEYSTPIEYVYDGIPMPSSTIFTTHPKGN